MIATIGSLVQETCKYRRWLVAAGLYAAACVTTAAVLGVAVAELGLWARTLLASFVTVPRASWMSLVVVGGAALGYSLSDMGLIRLPRPIVMEAVPVAWWRHWRPYGAAAAYGAALGLGITTRIPFGAFYVLSALCFVQGDGLYGACLMGSYGVGRALTIFPGSWAFAAHGHDVSRFLDQRLLNSWLVQRIMAAALAVLGAEMLCRALLSVR